MAIKYTKVSRLEFIKNSRINKIIRKLKIQETGSEIPLVFRYINLISKVSLNKIILAGSRQKSKRQPG